MIGSVRERLEQNHPGDVLFGHYEVGVLLALIDSQADGLAGQRELIKLQKTAVIDALTEVQRDPTKIDRMIRRYRQQ